MLGRGILVSMKYRVSIQILSLANTTPPPTLIVATYAYIMLLYTPSKSLSVSRATTTQIIYACIVHTRRCYCYYCASSRVKNLIIYRYFEVHAVGCHRLCVTIVSDVFIENTLAHPTHPLIYYLCAHRSYYTLLLW